jgi:hypothetical protein
VHVIDSVSKMLTNYFRMSELQKLGAQRGKKVGDEEGKTKRQITIEVAGQEKAGPIARFDFDTTTVYINRSLKVMHDPSLKRLEQFLFDMSKHAIAYARAVKEYRPLAKFFDLFQQEMLRVDDSIMKKGQTLGELISSLEKFKPEKKPTAIPLVDIRYYFEHELPELLGRPRAVISRLLESGVLEKKQRWKGNEIREVAKKLFGYTTIEEVVRKFIELKHPPDYVIAERKILLNIQNFGLKPYIKDIGNDGIPYYVVKNESSEEFFNIYSASRLHIRERRDIVYGAITVCKMVKEQAGIPIQPSHLIAIIQSRQEPWAVRSQGSGYKKGFSQEAVDTLIKKLAEPDFCKQYGIIRDERQEKLEKQV